MFARPDRLRYMRANQSPKWQKDRKLEMIGKDIQKELLRMQDIKYRDFQAALIPAMEKSHMIGVRTPQLREFAKRLAERDDLRSFLDSLPHEFFEEDQLHAFIISGMKDFDTCIDELERFLPFIDNWATCDQLTPKVFAKHRTELLPRIEGWLASEHTYTVRFAVGMLMRHFLDEDFAVIYPETVAKVRSGEYYIDMMKAWYFATALGKQYGSVLPFIEGRCLDPWTHNKAIQKAIESRRIGPQQKEYLRSLKV